MAANLKRFSELMQKGNVNSLINLLTSNMKGEILPGPGPGPILRGPVFQPILSNQYEDMVLKADQITKGGLGLMEWMLLYGGRYNLHSIKSQYHVHQW